jgi:Lrp/AsnC family leucine-responsive transcriptional regulator
VARRNLRETNRGKRMRQAVAVAGARRTELDPSDRRLLRALRADVRAPIGAIASASGMTVAAAGRRIERLRSSGVIRGYRLDLDPAAMGFPLHAFIQVGLCAQHADAIGTFRRWADRSEEVTDYWMMAGDGDFLLRVAVRDTVHFGDFLLRRLSKLGCVRSVSSSLVLSSGKSGALPPVL